MNQSEEQQLDTVRTQTWQTFANGLLMHTNPHQVLFRALSVATATMAAERGIIILFDEQEQVHVPAADSSPYDPSIIDIEDGLSALAAQVQHGAPLACTRTKQGCSCPYVRMPENSKTCVLSALCVPLKSKGITRGMFYLDNQNSYGKCDPALCDFLREFVGQISSAISFDMLHGFGHDHMQTAEAELRGSHRFEAIIGHHPKMVAILKLVAQVADTDATVLIQGESGTGKELIAQALHYNSRRRINPFVPINCAALPENLIESALFGHVRGAFTGAFKDHAGCFESAEGGTIFLDEVNDMPLPLQLKLLRVLQTGEFTRVGSTALRHCNVRVVAATSVNLTELVAQKKFREELLYRLKVIELTLPPLRERGEDILLLAQHFLQQSSQKHGKTGLRLSEEAEGALLSHDFPGNVRELENLIQRAVITAEGESLAAFDLPIPPAHSITGPPEKWSSFHVAKQHVVETFERQYLTDCLRLAKGNLTQAAKLADLHVTNLYHKLHQYGIDPVAFRR